MSNEVIVAIISSLGFGGLIVAAFNHFMGKKKELEQHQRERREGQYKELLENLPGFFSGTEDIKKKKKFMSELNTNALLFASSEVIRLGNKYLEGYSNKTPSKQLDKIANRLVIAIRNEMEVDKKDPLKVGDIVRYKLDD